MWFIRRGEFVSISKTRVAQSLAGSVTQIGLGWIKFASFGLIFGQTLNNGAGLFGLGFRLWINEQSLIKTISWSRMRAMFTKYIQFPKYSVLEAVSNNAAINIPVIMIAAISTGPEAGYLMMAIFTMQAPIGLISVAVSQVYLSLGPDEHRKESLGIFTANVIGGLIKSGVGPIIFAGILAPHLFPIVFGADWERAGILVAWMTPWFIMQFLSSTVSMALHITKNQKAALNLQLFGLILRVGFVYSANLVNNNYIAEAYALSGFIFYFTYLIVVLISVKAQAIDIFWGIRNGFFVVFLWVLFGCGFAYIAKALSAFVG
jgi:O-antigen/teichoic acid export membrane protein